MIHEAPQRPVSKPRPERVPIWQRDLDGPVITRRPRRSEVYKSETINNKEDPWISVPALRMPHLSRESLRHPSTLVPELPSWARWLSPVLHWFWMQYKIDPSGRVRPTSLLIGGVAGCLTLFFVCAGMLSVALHMKTVPGQVLAAAVDYSRQAESNPETSSTSSTDMAAQAASAARIMPATSASAVAKALNPESSTSERAHTSHASPSGGSGPMLNVPQPELALYRSAAASCGMSWEVLASVGYIETHHGQSTLPGVASGANFAGAEGPMQFLPSTWANYGVDGNHDGVKNIYDPADAIPGAANYLCANGAGDPKGVRNALWNYNHDDSYVNNVLAVATIYAEDAYVLPLPDGTVSMADMSKPHHDYSAVDIPVAVGTPAVAVHAGTVHTIDDSTCGTGVVIDGTDGFVYTYCHASSRQVSDGQQVNAGDLIMHTGGQPGSPGAGDATGPHLHLDIKANGHKVCPQSLFPDWAAGAFASPANAPSTGCSY